MSGDALDVIAEVVARLAYTHRVKLGRCTCGERLRVPSDSSHARHLGQLAATEITALGGLSREWGVVIDYPPRPEDDYPGAVVVLDTYKLREAAEIVKRTKYPEDDYELRSRWVSGWNAATS